MIFYLKFENNSKYFIIAVKQKIKEITFLSNFKIYIVICLVFKKIRRNSKGI